MQHMQAAQSYSYMTDGSQTMISFISGKIGQKQQMNKNECEILVKAIDLFVKTDLWKFSV